MLKIFFGYDKDAILNVDTFFNNTYEDEWLEDSSVARIIREVDGSEVQSRQCILSPVLGQIPPERLSGGAKALILMYKADEFYTDLIVCGSNCEDLILEIAEKKDLKCSLSGYDVSFKSLGSKYKTPVECLNDGSLLYTDKDFVLKMLNFTATAENRK